MIDYEEQDELDVKLEKVVDDSIKKLKKKLKKLKVAPDDYEDLRKAACALIIKLDACAPYINNAFLMKQLHGSRYTGPTFNEELEKLREVLGRRFR